jgi:glutamyl-tRNA reductase
MSDLLVNIEALGTSIRTDSDHVDDKKMDSKICLLSLKFDSNNIDVAKRLTTEGMSLQDRIAFVRDLSKTVDAEVFEFSTCNRVLFVGFDVDATTLAEGISSMTNLENIPFETMTGSDAWRHLVKISSGLDSFIVGELQVMSQLRSSINIHKENNLIRTFNLAFFEHIISATRIIRKELGYTSSTESMLNLATNSLESILAQKGEVKFVVLGFGDMGLKAVETLWSSLETPLNLPNVTHQQQNGAQ